MKYKNKGFIGLGLILAIVLGIVVVGGGAYYLGKSGSKEEVKVEENNLLNQENKNITATNSIVVPSDWKTYSNNEYGFSFNYPSSWKQPILSQQSTRNIIDFSNGFSVVTGFNYDQTKGGNLTITEITNSYINDNTLQNVKTQNLKIDGHLATKISYYGIDTKKNYTELYIYQDQQIQEKYIELVCDDSINNKLFDQITSSFKFIK